MTEILVSPPILRSTAAGMRQRTVHIRQSLNTVDEVIRSLDPAVFEGNRATSLMAHYRAMRERILHWPSVLDQFSTDLANAADLFEKADKQPSSSWSSSTPTPAPVPTPKPGPIPTPVPDSNKGSFSLEAAIKSLGDILAPIDWIDQSAKATKQFDQTLESIGRFLNSVTGQRGYIKEMSELGDLLKGTTNVVDGLNDFLFLKDSSQFFSGHLTNAEMGRDAINVLIPIPILNTKIADWLVANMPDPNGTWHGLITPVE